MIAANHLNCAVVFQAAQLLSYHMEMTGNQWLLGKQKNTFNTLQHVDKTIPSVADVDISTVSHYLPQMIQIVQFG